MTAVQTIPQSRRIKKYLHPAQVEIDSFFTSKILDMFKGKEYMTGRQQVLAEEFEAEIESEYALCIAQIQKAQQAIEGATAGLTEQEQNLANSEIDALRKYWYERLEALINLLSWRDPKLLQQLNEKYPQSLS